MVYRTVSTTVDVEVDLDDFEDEELQDELNRRRGDDFEDEELQDELNRRRGWQSGTILEDLLETWVSRRDRFEDEFRAYCREILGRSF